MSKGNGKNNQCNSTFTLTFAIEILGVDVWHDCNEGWLDLEACEQGMKIHYQLYHEQSFDIDILIWPHVAKIWCGNQHCFVRTWQFLERRWLAFTIRHVFPVRVLDMINHVATITPCMGIGALSANAKNDKNIEAYLPPLNFAELRYFGRVLDNVESLEEYIRDFIWAQIESHIPFSYFDGPFNTPQCVTDSRHQNLVLKLVRESILNKAAKSVQSEEMKNKSEVLLANDNKKSKAVKKTSVTEQTINIKEPKLDIRLSGNTILAGIGEVVPFESTGRPPADMGEIICLISSTNLPAQDDLPIIFVNVKKLLNIPVQDLKKLSITHLYVKWKLVDKEHFSQKLHVEDQDNINFNDFNSIPLQSEVVSEITSKFLDNPVEIQVRGIIKSDVGVKTSAVNNEDVLIAVTKIDGSQLSKGPNAVIKGEYSLYPFNTVTKNLERNYICTNDINAIKRLEEPQVVVPPYIILKAHMSLEIAIGIVGCKPRHLITSYLRFFCIMYDSEIIEGLTMKVTEINKEIALTDNTDGYLTGFAIDAGEMAIAYIEGLSDGTIIEISKFTKSYLTKIKVLFSLTDKYPNRIYTEMLSTSVPFFILKMFTPLNLLLACPAVYVKPVLPVPAKTALLKIGRLISNKLKLIPNRSDMPTFEELASFRLELCVPTVPALACCDQKLVFNPDTSLQQRIPRNSS